jgi:hypothetical protein
MKQFEVDETAMRRANLSKLLNLFQESDSK